MRKISKRNLEISAKKKKINKKKCKEIKTLCYSNFFVLFFASNENKIILIC